VMLAERAGHWGVTAWEAIQALDAEENEYTVRPRLTELASEHYGHMLRKTAWRRPNKRGNDEAVYVIKSHYVAHLHEDIRKMHALLSTPNLSPTLPKPASAAQ